jgi:thiamine-monophosphate kinase
MAEPRSEFAFIEWIRARAAPHHAVPIGIGDDAALVRIGSGDCLVTADMLMEGIDFLAETPPRDVGRKALAASLSDIAAMAGRPLAAVVSLAAPQDSRRRLIEPLYEGLEKLARAFDVAIAGGDTNAWDGPLVINVTLLGEPTGGGPVRRHGACAGDWLFVTGELGGSLAGKHLSFVPRVREAIELHRAVSLHAMIDISDGLAADLHHLLDESGVGAVVHSAAIPISDAARAMPGQKSPLERALSDGEDFELLFTVSPEEGRRLLAAPPFETPLSHIGEIVEGRDCELIEACGRRTPLEARGWAHSV